MPEPVVGDLLSDGRARGRGEGNGFRDVYGRERESLRERDREEGGGEKGGRGLEPGDGRQWMPMNHAKKNGGKCRRYMICGACGRRRG